ncbi:ISAs1 family transposase [Gemmata obscuriglobus]|uniref:ISAs1 family transposase n=1 Tax=Gemmata obscuriglobus TaxID=114 RepID=A0A2Z3HEZ6_9BACT|nr:ISAs1 family transposase [Gemmata obscuriglobus]AWM41515.1 ISAs1 family transposase [Gemmata obscuriglobus]
MRLQTRRRTCPGSLVERLAELPDPRSRHGRQYPLVGLLTLCLVAAMGGHTTPAAISQFGRRQKRLGHALGFKNGNMPCANTIAGRLRKLDPDHLDRIIGDWRAGRHPEGWEHLALDGRQLRGSRDGEVPGAHRLAAYAPGAAAVVAQMTVEATTNEHKAALRLLGVLPPLGGTVVIGDAICTQPDVCAAVQQRGGDDTLYAKSNQGTLRADLEAAFATAAGGDFPPRVTAPVGPGRGHRM